MGSREQKERAREKKERRTALIDTAYEMGAVRLKVINNRGREKWRELDRVQDTDDIQCNKAGAPIIMFKTPGPKSKDLSPTSPAVIKMMRERQEALKNDPLLEVVKGSPDSLDVLQHAMIGLAEEASSIQFERHEAERQGEDTVKYSKSRVVAIKALSDVWLRRKDQVVTNAIDLDSPMFESVMAHVLQTFRGCMKDAGVDNNRIRVVFARLAKEISSEEWKKGAKNRMKRDL